MSDERNEPVLVETEHQRLIRIGSIGVVIPIICGLLAYGICRKLYDVLDLSFGDMSNETSAVLTALPFFIGFILPLFIKSVRDAFLEVVFVLGILAGIVALLYWLFV